jgi:hypothetical protein
MSRYFVIAVVTLALGSTSTNALAASQQDANATHTALVAAYASLHGIVDTWPKVEASLSQLNRKLAAECPHVGAGSPQNESDQRLSYEVAGALWATAYHTDAKYANSFINAVSPLRWSNRSIVRRGLNFIVGLREMMALKVPNVCGDVRTWIAGGFTTVPADTEQFDDHVEAIDVEIPSPKILAPYVRPSDRGLLQKVERLLTRFDELEFTVGQRYWDTLLETLAINQ